MTRTVTIHNLAQYFQLKGCNCFNLKEFKKKTEFELSCYTIIFLIQQLSSPFEKFWTYDNFYELRSTRSFDLLEKLDFI
jgi:hypothetical protein